MTFKENMDDGDKKLEKYHNDQVLVETSEDFLGYNSLSNRIGEILTNPSLSKGAVLGLDGQWGMGKSTILGFSRRSLKDKILNGQLAWAEFSPWLVGSRESLISELFTVLSTTIAGLKFQKGNIVEKQFLIAKELAQDIQEFGRNLKVPSETGALSELVVPGSGAYVSIGLKRAMQPKDEKALIVQKGAISKKLWQLETRIVVTIDDLDRLDPDEIVEILRLLKSVANFPNVVYAICYDHDAVSQAVETVTGIQNGSQYLEKIIQLPISVPAPESFSLRRMFREKFSDFKLDLNSEEQGRLEYVIDSEGGRRLNSPRAVNRCLDMISAYLPVLKNKIDIADFVWLQMIKLGNRELYQWIEVYLNTMAAKYSGRVAVSEHGIKQSFQELKEIISDDNRNLSRTLIEWQNILPGFDGGSISDSKPPIFTSDHNEVIQERIKDRRLASVDHYRLFFALTEPEAAPLESDFVNLKIALTKNNDAAEALLLNWGKQKDSLGDSKAVRILDRLENSYPDSWNPGHAVTLAVTFSNVMDDDGLRGREQFMFSYPGWRIVSNILADLLKKIDNTQRLSTLKQMFEGGRAIGWLTRIFRRETFSHGVFGDDGKPRDEWTLDEDEYTLVAELLVQRYQKMSLDDLSRTPEPISILYAWKQANVEKKLEVEKLVGNDDSQFLQFLSLLTTESEVNGKIQTNLNRENIEAFLELDPTLDRLRSIIDNSESQLFLKAQALLSMYRKDKF
ncbi:P-loop NTPase fold protein [Sphingorhabdus sp. EL138]|uniref:KAP family P-loop NTPase fold protein n=1 Tax=Sphingorhabdus sp. EL138 TaxID=2073156 RepID=UPI000D692916|nr:P-loop NTPase fold protein [Sphingorhabdus sp. EL138]